MTPIHLSAAEARRIALLGISPEKAGQMRRGYVIEPKGVRIGLTGANVTPGFSFVRLARVDPPDPKRLWKLPAASISAAPPDGMAFRGEGGSSWTRASAGCSWACPAPFVNTRLRPLGSFRYLYDAEGGYWGLERPRRGSPAVRGRPRSPATW